MIEVVAAMICREDRFLLCQRPAHKARGLLWEFPGGKVEAGETGPQALARECREELGVTLEVGAPLAAVEHDYPELTIRLTLYRASILAGEPAHLEHPRFAWVAAETAEAFALCPADRLLWAQLQPLEPLRRRLFALQDLDYRAFHCRLIPNVPPERVIGIRTPALRALARDFAKTPEATRFLTALPHVYYEENNLHGFLVEQGKDFAAVVQALDEFLPYVDNWATCDLMRPKVFSRHLPELLPCIRRWMASRHPYTIRFGIEMLMTFYLDEAFQPEQLAWVAGLRSEEYYVNMMIAWYFATALAKQYEAALPYLQERRLTAWTHNKTIRKAVESYRITAEQKNELRALRHSGTQ